MTRVSVQLVAGKREGLTTVPRFPFLSAIVPPFNPGVNQDSFCSCSLPSQQAGPS